MNIRIVNAYGPQEYDDQFKKEQFWAYLDKEVLHSQNLGSGLMIFTDANAWMGPELLKNDVHSQNRNGKMFSEFMSRNPDLSILNCESFCEGLITRSIMANGKRESSVIDFVIVCDKVLPFVDRFMIDENKVYALSNYSRKNRVQHSDHNSLITNLNMRYDLKKPERRIIYNFRDLTSMMKFKKKTSNKGLFTNI